MRLLTLRLAMQCNAALEKEPMVPSHSFVGALCNFLMGRRPCAELPVLVRRSTSDDGVGWRGTRGGRPHVRRAGTDARRFAH